MKRETPEWARKALLLAGGKNRFGEPNFRVSWGDSLVDWIGGRWEDRDTNGHLLREVAELRQVIKYPLYVNRWIVERWNPPEMYGSPEKWYRQTREKDEGYIPQLGPYPSRGRYAFVCVLDLNGKFVQLTPTILDDVIYAAIYKREHIPSLAQLKQAQEEKEERWMQESKEFLERPAFDANEFVTVA